MRTSEEQRFSASISRCRDSAEDDMVIVMRADATEEHLGLGHRGARRSHARWCQQAAAGATRVLGGLVHEYHAA